MEKILNSNDNIVNQLREKTEAADMHKHLKNTFGGYTKKSVQEYFNLLRKQYQTAQENFNRNLEAVFQEKESLRNDHEVIINRYNKLSLEYDNLTESIKTIELLDTEYSQEELLSLQKNTVALEEELKKLNEENNSLNNITSKLNKDVSDLNFSLELSNKEAEAQKQLLISEKQESRKLRDKIIAISRQLEEEKNEVKYLKNTMSEGKFTQLNSKISELSEQLSALTEVNKIQAAENSLKEQTIVELNEEISLINQRLSSSQKSEKIISLQNNKLLSANEELKNALEEEFKKSINMINEKSSAITDKLIAEQSLRDAEARLAAMEIKAEKQYKFGA
ncbi:MAG: hypothetical protein SA378_00970 [Sedimentibacter sp.]|uniref:hypothetical protein n=1 Tax=Sedimentibacter sp. TaxID=1960295 RepID=UPI0029821FBC|nr:hypothetical protein [Sedimentibacter sp.]MDW5298702.1 hypothetical protein [Sedimentibacter sp.]